MNPVQTYSSTGLNKDIEIDTGAVQIYDNNDLEGDMFNNKFASNISEDDEEEDEVNLVDEEDNDSDDDLNDERGNQNEELVSINH
eukprot:CAMPEP_0176383148 /NCGR_PEP_ID=MMETSP0126-20121128/33259_1 /TAXON_ID=141414 ORGANISM="Strombidinopsis acuminatum, Strain SPMC142" /NCGR_SAMPLE_ID=MMETSP0126 /ASSEMBLY_ACC=CAM_ASM_000229 /LENGTH=84 /DNA_ID=CAMNT_0017748017 /DNA_START=409 /DNA_END=663 /DNA_ORIENTATION=-